MKKNSLAVTAVAVIAVAIVTYKQWIQMPPAAFGTPKVTAKNGTGLSLLLIAEPRQASELDGCGVIVGMVRAAAARGVPVREISPDVEPDVISRYHIVVLPSVLVLEKGGARRLYEGESPETVESIRAEIGALEDHQ